MMWPHVKIVAKINHVEGKKKYMEKSVYLHVSYLHVNHAIIQSCANFRQGCVTEKKMQPKIYTHLWCQKESPYLLNYD